MSKLITTSLIGSINWFENAPTSYKQQAYLDLKNMLGRKKYEMTDYAKRGVEFENLIYGSLRLKDQSIEQIKCSDNFRKFLTACKGGKFQEKIKFFMDINDIEYCIYGKIDVLFPNKIIDIKTTSKWDSYSESKYLDSFQHKLYCYGKEITDFEYMIAVFDGKKIPIVDIKHLHYHVDDFEVLRIEIKKKIQAVQVFLNANEELLKLHTDTYSLY